MKNYQELYQKWLDSWQGSPATAHLNETSKELFLELYNDPNYHAWYREIECKKIRERYLNFIRNNPSFVVKPGSTSWIFDLTQAEKEQK